MKTSRKINYEKYDAKLTKYNKVLLEFQSNLNSFDTRKHVLKDRSNNITFLIHYLNCNVVHFIIIYIKGINLLFK